jgi:uncharacterized protein (UPF0332 family)
VTKDNKKANVQAELERASQSLEAASALLDRGLYADSISRAYYATLHLLRALLFSRGVEPKSHSGALHLFNVELVRTGEVSGSWNRLLAGLQRSRELADYDSAVLFSEEEARAVLTDARSFGDAALEYLRKGGWAK